MNASRYDLEATTNKTRTLHPVEIIEVSCVIIHSATASIRASYQSFVRPTEHPRLDPFVTELCGIEQNQVDRAPLLADVLQQHHGWLQQQGVLDEGVSCIPVTWTEWDFKVGPSSVWQRTQSRSYPARRMTV
jgi:inhibitor of KinA sporulation pathway (predicted exonuclease)